MLHPKRTDEGSLVAAWREQLQRANKNPFLLQLLLKQWQRILKRLAYFYAQLASLPRRNRRALQRALATSLIGAAMLLAMSNAPIVHAASITVSGACTLDEAITNANDDAPTFPDCAAGSGADTIFLTGNVTIGTDTPAAELPDITTVITLEGGGNTVSGAGSYRVFYVSTTGDFTVNETTITGGKATDGGGISNRGVLTVTNSTITDNDAYCNGNYCSAYGGGIVSFSTLNIINSTISGNSVDCVGTDCIAYGGGIAHITGTAILRDSYVTGNSSSMYDGGIHNGGTMTLYNTTVSGNDATIYGAGIHNEYESLTLNNSTVSDNTLSTGFGYLYGGAGIVSNPETTLILNDSTISGNGLAFVGGGILSGGDTTINRSRVQGNGGYFGGGVAMVGGTVSVSESTITGNQAFFGGGILDAYGSLVVNQSTINGNYALVGAGIGAGYSFSFRSAPPPINPEANNGRTRNGWITPALSADVAKKFPKLQGNLSKPVRQLPKFAGHQHRAGTHAKLAPQDGCSECPPPAQIGIVNSTISGNTAVVAGGGVANAYGIINMYNVTVTNNTATDGSGNGKGGGIANTYYGQVTLARTIVSGNSADTYNEIDNYDGTITGANYNLFGHSGETNAQAFYGFTPSGSDITATSDGTMPTALAAILNTTLGNNGGPTQTNALVANSPAIDQAPSADCVPPPTNNVDQRGAARNFDGNNSPSSNECDIGAYEYGSPTAVNVTGFSAMAHADKNILKWHTTSEAQIAGFNVYRKVGKNRWKQINKKFKQAKHAGAPSGANYTARDKQVLSGKTYRYKVQVVYLDGHNEWTNVQKIKR